METSAGDRSLTRQDLPSFVLSPILSFRVLTWKKENGAYVMFTLICPLLQLLAGRSAWKVLCFIISWFYFVVYQNSGLLTSGYGRGHFFACGKWSKWVHLWIYIWVGLFYEGQFFTMQCCRPLNISDLHFYVFWIVMPWTLIHIINSTVDVELSSAAITAEEEVTVITGRSFLLV